ncbi:MAG TPA: histidine kinase [Ktedonobacteraceae bacterium]|nr:histidine kinase [Ktedonobacteraceae bacterium]
MGSTLEAHSRGRWLFLARLSGGALLVFNLTVFFIGLPLYFAHYQTVCRGVTCAPWQLTPQSVKTLQGLGFSATGYATVCLVLGVVAVVVSCAIAGLITFRKPDNWMGLLVAFLLVMGSTNYLTADVAVLGPLFGPMLAEAVSKCFNFLMTVTEMLVFCLFPNGRFVPRWTRWLMGAFLAGALFTLAVPPASSLVRFLILWGSFLIIVSLAQLYRYRRVSNSLERRQTKWVVYGLALEIVIGVGIISLPYLFPSLMQAGSLYGLVTYLAVNSCSTLFLALCFGIAILHSRLYDIDVLINRTLVYALLTASTLGLYVLVVFGASALVRASNDLVFSLVATALVAVLFQPLRQWLQHGVNRLMFGDRDEPYTLITRLSKQLEATMPAEKVLPTIVETVAQALKLPYAAITLREGEAFPLAASYGTMKGALMHLPLVYQAEHVGELLLAPRAPGDSFTPADRKLLDDLARQVGVAAHAMLLTQDLQRLTQDLQQARERLVAAREEERRRLRRDLHDGLGPQLSSQALLLTSAQMLLRQDPDEVEAILKSAVTQSQQAISDIRRLVYALRPPALDDLGLLASIEEQLTQYRASGIVFSLEAPEQLPSLPAAVEVACYRIVQEALTNAVRHAQAQSCVVRLACQEQLTVEVTDDGLGLSPAYRCGVGLSSMRERAEELGGSWRIEPAPQGGTHVQAELPYR